MAIVVPPGTIFPVWLVAADGRSELVLDGNGYVAAVSAGASPVSAMTPTRTIVSDVGVLQTLAETNLGPSQRVSVPPGLIKSH